MNAIELKTLVDKDVNDGPCLRTHLFIDGVDLVDLERDSLGINLRALLASVDKSGEYFIVTCECGDAGCAGITKGIEVTHVLDSTKWSGTVKEKQIALRFSRRCYEKAIQDCVADLKRMVDSFPALELVPGINRSLAANGGIP